jgi:hypothetical protein
MMGFYTLEDVLLSIGFDGMSPEMNDARIIENRLIDGSMHIQTVGDSRRYRTFTLISNEEQVEVIDPARAIGSKFKLVIDDKYYIGFISKPTWERITRREPIKTNRWYQSAIEFTITEEGSI